jgi:predicted DNA-binding transcriptional regulator AlpA
MEQRTETSCNLEQPISRSGRGNHDYPLLDREQLAHELTVSLRTIDKLQHQGMPCVFIGRRARRFILSEVIAWLRRRKG